MVSDFQTQVTHFLQNYNIIYWMACEFLKLLPYGT